MTINRELSQLANLITIDESGNKNVGIATTVRISGGGGVYVGGIEVIDATGVWKGSSSGLIGAQGTTGAQGTIGTQGTTGAQGAIGAQGTTGTQGTQGTTGPTGGSSGQVLYNSGGTATSSSNLTFDGSNLGVGTASPASALDVATSNSGITLTNTAVSNKKWRLGGNTSGYFQITETGVADRLTIDTSGRFGIGTASPSATLQVSPSSGSANFQVSRGSKGLQINQDSDSADPNINTIGTTALKFLRDGSESMRIDTSGRLLVGTTTPSMGSPLLHVQGSQSTNGLANFANNTNSGDVNHGIINLINTATGATGNDARIMFTFRQVGLSSGLDPMASIGAVKEASDFAAAIQFNTRSSSGAYSEKMRLDSSGRFGIGTTNPLNPLVVSNGGANGFEVSSATNSGTTSYLLSYNRSTSAYTDMRLDASAFRFEVSATERMRLTSTGLGIGTTNPGDVLDTAAGNYRGITIKCGTTTNRPTLSFFNTADSLAAYIQATGNSLQFGAMGTDYGGHTPRMSLTSTGLGIGTTSPATSLHLLGANTAARGQLSVAGNSDNPRITLYRDSSFIGAMFGDTTNGVSIAAETGYSITFNPGGTSEKARFDSSGRLLVGTSSASRTGTAFLQGSSAGATGDPTLVLARGLNNPSDGATLGAIVFTDSGHQDSVQIYASRDGGTWTSGSSMPSRLIIATTANGASSPTERMRIDNGGTIYATSWYNGTTVNAANVNVVATGVLQRSTSSIKYKKDVETLEDVYADAILNCRPVWYRSKCESDDPSWGWWGFIAEEVAEIDPRLVSWKTSETSYDESGAVVNTPLEAPEPEGVQYDRFVPHLLNLIKRQKEQIEAMEARLTALESA